MTMRPASSIQRGITAFARTEDSRAGILFLHLASKTFQRRKSGTKGNDGRDVVDLLRKGARRPGHVTAGGDITLVEVRVSEEQEALYFQIAIFPDDLTRYEV